MLRCKRRSSSRMKHRHASTLLFSRAPCVTRFNVCDASYCSIQQWKQIVAALKDGNPKVKVLAYVETVDEFEEMRAKELLEADAQIAMDEVGVDGCHQLPHARGRNSARHYTDTQYQEFDAL